MMDVYSGQGNSGLLPEGNPDICIASTRPRSLAGQTLFHWKLRVMIIHTLVAQ